MDNVLIRLYQSIIEQYLNKKVRNLYTEIYRCKLIKELTENLLSIKISNKFDQNPVYQILHCQEILNVQIANINDLIQVNSKPLHLLYYLVEQIFFKVHLKQLNVKEMQEYILKQSNMCIYDDNNVELLSCWQSAIKIINKFETNKQKNTNQETIVNYFIDLINNSQNKYSLIIDDYQIYGKILYSNQLFSEETVKLFTLIDLWNYVNFELNQLI